VNSSNSAGISSSTAGRMTVFIAAFGEVEWVFSSLAPT